MKKYTRKPTQVEAVRFDGNPSSEVLEWAEGNLVYMGSGKWIIKTLEGHSYPLTTEDFIVKGIKGEFYPCKADIFELTYE